MCFVSKYWKAALEQKYTAIPGITEMHDIVVSKLRLGKTTVTHGRVCFNGGYTARHNYKFNAEQPLSDLSAYEPVQLSAEKVRQLSEQYRRYVKQDVPHYKIPAFLKQTRDPVAASDTQQKKKRQCTYPGCDGSGHVNPASKRHLSEKNCPQAAKKPHN